MNQFFLKVYISYSVVLTAANRNRTKDYSIQVTLRVDSVLYTGKLKSQVKKEVFDRVLKAGTAQNITMPVSYAEYAPELSDQCAFNIACLANVKETNFEFFSQDDFRVRKPDIAIKVDFYDLQYFFIKHNNKF